MLRLSIFPNNTYSVQIDSKVIVSPVIVEEDGQTRCSLLEDWDFVVPPFHIHEKYTPPQEYQRLLVRRGLPTSQDWEVKDHQGNQIAADSLNFTRQIPITEASLHTSAYLKSAEKRYEKIKNREFMPSTHSEAYLLDKIKGIQISVEQSSPSFMIGSILLTDSTHLADKKTKKLQKAYDLYYR